jgi:hypothetical protein
VSWQTPTGVAALYRSVVTPEDLPDDEVLRSTPGIFQEIVSVKLRSQEVPEAQLDWRRAARVPMEPFDLPVSVAAACRQIMANLGIVFGCFDLIVTPRGDYVFLEVNEAGAFLWIEEQLPEIRLLDAFCEFFRQARVDFRWTQSKKSIALAEVAEKADYQREEIAPRLHRLPHGGSIPDTL